MRIVQNSIILCLIVTVESDGLPIIRARLVLISIYNIYGYGLIQIRFTCM